MLSVQDLRIIDDQRTKRNHDAYKHILNEVYEKIKKKNKNNFKNLIYTIPFIKYGFPIINTDRAMQYIIRKLNKGGFVVYPYKNCNSVYIDWSVRLNHSVKEQVNVKTFKRKSKVELSDKFLDKQIRKMS